MNRYELPNLNPTPRPKVKFRDMSLLQQAAGVVMFSVLGLFVIWMAVIVAGLAWQAVLWVW